MTGKKRRKNDNDNADDNLEHGGSGPPGTAISIETSPGGAKPAVQERQKSALAAEL
jgi:hypothetical protein